jgi:hypothetical protein
MRNVEVGADETQRSEGAFVHAAVTEAGRGRGDDVVRVLTIDSSRRGTKASSSSKKITHGAEALARANTCRTAFSLSPTYYRSASFIASVGDGKTRSRRTRG